MIESPSNPLIKKISKLHEKKYRDEYGLFIIEGERFCDEAEPNYVEHYIVSEDFKALEKYEAFAKTITVSAALFKKISETVSPQGVLAVCRQKKHEAEALFDNENPFIIIGERISDPGNLGTLIRTADAAGCSALVLSEGSADVYNAKTLRASAGAVFHIPVYTNIDLIKFVQDLKRKNIFTVGSHLNASRSLYEADMKKPLAIAIGNEANGLSDSLSKELDMLVKIPMPGRAESLNASVAGGVLIYEALRQRSCCSKANNLKYINKI